MNEIGEFSREELQKALKLKNSDNFRKNYLRLALDLKLIDMTIPDKPTSKLQCYRLTEKGICTNFRKYCARFVYMH